MKILETIGLLTKAEVLRYMTSKGITELLVIVEDNDINKYYSLRGLTLPREPTSRVSDNIERFKSRNQLLVIAFTKFESMSPDTGYDSFDFYSKNPEYNQYIHTTYKKLTLEIRGTTRAYYTTLKGLNEHQSNRSL